MPGLHTSATPATRRWFSPAIVAATYLVLSAVYTQPLLWKLTTGLPFDAGDPGLNASVFDWNARTIPFSSAWWNAPQYFPTEGIAAFTESMVGFAPFSSPIVWLTGNHVLAYNVAIFLTWPLSAFAAYLLVKQLTHRRDAAFIAGLAFAFNPFRYYETSHVQMLATEWMPLVLLGLHAYLEGGRIGWLGLFAAAWLLNALSNGHFMLFVAVLIGVWLAYFGTRRDTWRRAATLLGVWMATSLALVPVFLKYQAIHDHFNIHRAESEIIYFSAEPAAWARIAGNIWFWGKFLPDGKDDLFPGVTVLVLIVAAVSVLLWRRRDLSAAPSRTRRVVQALLASVIVISVISILFTFVWGPWEWTVGSVRLYKMGNLQRVLIWLTISTIGLVAMTRSMREALSRRSPLVFYAFGVLLFAVLACGPILRVGEQVILSPMPYRGLMALPGFMELRVPARFWMVSVACLSIAAGLAYSHLRPTGARTQRLAFLGVVSFIIFECWIPSMPVAAAPDAWPIVEAPERIEPILELPIGPNDYAATFRTAHHHRRLVNGVSGYNPPYYLAIAEGLSRLDPGSLDAVASYSPLDVVITEADDPKGEIRRYVEAYPGARRIASDGQHVAFHLPQGRAEPTLGSPLPIVSVKMRGLAEWVKDVHDGKMDTGWGETPQTPDQHVVIDLGAEHEVGGVSLAIGDYFLDFPRHIALDLSVDATTWTTVWDSPTMGPMMRAWVRAPRKADMRMPFATKTARYVRIRQTEAHFRMWRISEVDVHAPVR